MLKTHFNVLKIHSNELKHINLLKDTFPKYFFASDLTLDCTEHQIRANVCLLQANSQLRFIIKLTC